MTRQIILKVNGAVRADPAMLLIWALREELSVTDVAACSCRDLQCGDCQSRMLVAVATLLLRHSKPVEKVSHS